MNLPRPANLPRPSVTRVALAVVLAGLPVVYLLVIAVAWWRYGEPPDWAPHVWLTAGATTFLGGLALAIVGAIALGMERWSERVWPHLLQLWGVGLVVEGVLHILFVIFAVDVDNAVYGHPWGLLGAVAVLAVVVTPALVAWRTVAWLRRPGSTAEA
jgi:hypothetical protein